MIGNCIYHLDSLAGTVKGATQPKGDATQTRLMAMNALRRKTAGIVHMYTCMHVCTVLYVQISAFSLFRALNIINLFYCEPFALHWSFKQMLLISLKLRQVPHLLQMCIVVSCSQLALWFLAHFPHGFFHCSSNSSRSSGSKDGKANAKNEEDKAAAKKLQKELQKEEEERKKKEEEQRIAEEKQKEEEEERRKEEETKVCWSALWYKTAQSYTNVYLLSAIRLRTL